MSIGKGLFQKLGYLNYQSTTERNVSPFAITINYSYILRMEWAPMISSTIHDNILTGQILVQILCW